MPIDINELETPDQEKIRLGMEKKRADAEAFVSTESNNNSGQPAIPKSSNFAGISPHDFNPYQTDQQGNIDYGASAARAIPEATVGYIGLKGIQGLGEGLKRTLSGENRGIKVQERQLKLQENQGVKPTVVSEAGIDPETAQKMRFAEEQHIAKLRRDEELHQAKLQANGIKPNEINTVPPALAGSSVELPSTSTPGIQTAPTATGESALNMLPPVNPATPQGSIPGAPNVQATSATLPAVPPATPAQQVVQQATGTAPTTPVPASMPIGQTTPNPVESGEGVSPLHEAGSAVGETPLQATTESTVQPEKKVVKGAAVPRRSKQETQVANEEMPFNKYYNQVANRLAGTENLREHPHITEQFDKAWEDVFHNVLGGKMEKSQAGAPAKIHEIESHIKANSEKYPDLVKYMNEAKTYGKGGIHPTEGGASHLGAMLGLLGAGGLGAYMIHRYGKPYEESMEKANKAMGDTSGTQDLLQKANKAEELSPAMRQIFMKSGNPNYRRELNEQLANEKEPERIKELKRELEKAK